jgi:DNA-binding MarR family transcriptional regulator
MSNIISPLPKWIMKHYSKLWSKFNDKQFTHQQAEDLLKITNTSIVLSRLKKYGWLELTLDPNDSRKRLYKLKDPSEAVKEIGKR